MKKLTIILSILFAAAFAQAQVIEHTYHFSQPNVVTKDGYQQINLEGCLPKGQVGEPTLPWQSVSLMLPQGQEATAMTVEFLDYMEMDGSYMIYPYQQPRPYSNEETIPFTKNDALYRSSDPYPARNYGEVSTQYLNGVAFAFGGFTPVQYVPATGKVSIARTVRVRIETTASRDNHSRKLWLTPENQASMERLAQNANMLSTYEKRGREIGGYDMLVITAEEWIPRFGEYLNLYNGKGIRTQIVSLEEIYATMDGRDEQEQIRNYIIQEYENNGISMVSLGGDVSIVPFRFLWCFAQEGYEDQLPADMYYACLDGTLNDDNDEFWGEVGEDDLLPELGIGRLPFNNETQFEIIMHKTLSYLHEPVLGEFTSPVLGAEHLGDGYYGSDDLERLIGSSSDFGYTTYGYPTDYNFKKYYAAPDKPWSGGGFKQVIGTGGQYVHHVGHANTDVVAGWEGSMMSDNFFPGNDGINHNFMLFHSHGCICGNFPHDCILEKMVTIPTGFVVTTGNSRYGWYVPWGDGMAAHIHREFVDAYCNDLIPSVGMALREAKIATAPWVTVYGEEGCLRWNIYCLNVLGDAALCPWFEEPFNPNVTYEQGLMVGTTSTTVNVKRYDEPLGNFRVCLFDGETLLASALTNANGDAVLNFDPAIETVGAMQLIVTGQSAWPQVLEVNGFESGEAYVYGELLDLSGESISGNQLFVSGNLYNKGDVTAYNVIPRVTSDCEYITAFESGGSGLTIEPNGTCYFDNIGAFEIANNIPDQTVFTLELNAQVGNVTHTTGKSFVAMAPMLQFTDVVVDDSEGNGNGFIDPGERITLHVSGANAGHAMAPGSFLTVSCDDERIYFEENTVPIGDINVRGSFTANLVFTSDNDIVNGTLFRLDMALQTGEYTTPYQYYFTDGQIAETFESGDFSFMDWRHGGELPWFVTDDEAHTGQYSARTGAIDNSEFSRLILYADVLSDGEIGFYFKTSTEYHHDYFAFYIDDKKKDWWSGEIDWTFISYPVSEGSHCFEWLYAKNPKNIAGSDCAWIDDITLPRACIVTEVEVLTTPKPAMLYPNPSHGIFTIDLVEESNVAIFNVLGQCVMSLQQVSGSHEVHLDNVPRGMYLVQIQGNSGVETLRLMLE